jgi:hypothetical protein
MDIAIYVCLEDFYDTTTPSSMKIYPIVDFKFLVLDIQFASLYLSSTIEGN